MSGKGMFVGQYGEESHQYRQFLGQDAQYAAEQPGYGQLTAYQANPYAPDPYAPDPYAPDPYAPDPYAPDPYAPDPYAPDPYPSASGPYAYGPPPVSSKSRLTAGLLAVFLGSLGVHNFYLGRVGRAVLQLLVTLLTLGLLAPLVVIWTLVEGILILIASPGFTTDGKGLPLRD